MRWDGNLKPNNPIFHITTVPTVGAKVMARAAKRLGESSDKYEKLAASLSDNARLDEVHWLVWSGGGGLCTLLTILCSSLWQGLTRHAVTATTATTPLQCVPLLFPYNHSTALNTQSNPCSATNGLASNL